MKIFQITTFLAVFLLILSAQDACGQEEILKIVELQGNVLIKTHPSAEWLQASAGQCLKPNDSIKTSDNSKVTLEFPDKSKVSLKSNSEFTVEELSWSQAATNVGIDMSVGELKAVIKSLNAPSKFRVKTPNAVCGVRGTTFYVEVTPEEVTTLFVDEGSIELRNTISGMLFNVNQGTQSSSSNDGGITPPVEPPQEDKDKWRSGWESGGGGGGGSGGSSGGGSSGGSGGGSGGSNSGAPIAEPYTAPGGALGGGNLGGMGGGFGGDRLLDLTEHQDDRNTNTNTGTTTTTTTTTTEVPTSFHDDFGQYADQTAINGLNGWVSDDTYTHTGWKIGEELIETMDGAEHNYLRFEPSPLPAEGFSSDSNYATYHVAAGASFDTLAVSFYHQVKMNADLTVEVSGNNGSWVDISKLLQMKKGTSENDSRGWEAYADLTSIISDAQIENDLYLRFSSAASSDASWASSIVDPTIYRNHLSGLSRDDFASFADQEAINGKGDWTSGDVYDDRNDGWLAETTQINGVDHNIIHFHPTPWPGDGGGFTLGSNDATYHVASAELIDKLALSTDYYVMPRSDMKAYISGDTVTWVDITDKLGIGPSVVEGDWRNGFADLTAYLNSANILNDFYIRFTGAAYSGEGWGIGVGNIEVTRGDIEKALIRNELRDVLELNTLAQLDDYAIRNQDAQAGFVMTDMHGNRVRIAQYLFMPDNKKETDTTVKLVNINSRSGDAGPLSGITTAEYNFTFNIKPPTDPKEFRNLPWNDIFSARVATKVGEAFEEKDSSQWGTGGEEWTVIAHTHAAGLPTYWVNEFSLKVTNPKEDYFFVSEWYNDPTLTSYKEVGELARDTYLQLQDDTKGRLIIANAGTEIFNYSWNELSGSGADNLMVPGSQNSNWVQDPLDYLNDNPHIEEAYYTDFTRTDKIRPIWNFYLIDSNGKQMPYDTHYIDNDHTATEDREFRFNSVVHVLSAERVGNLEISFACDDMNGNSLITAPIDVVIPQGASDVGSDGKMGILRIYDTYTHDDGPE